MADSRIRIGKQAELSVTPQSVIKTDALNEQEYLPPGNDGEVLSVVAGVVQWSPTCSNSAQIKSISADYSVLVTDNILIADVTASPITVTIDPALIYDAATTCTRIITINAIDTDSDQLTLGNALTIAPLTGNISGQTNFTYLNEYESLTIVSDGTNLHVI